MTPTKLFRMFYLKWNKICADVRSHFISPKLNFRDFSLFSNDCTGGVLLHKLKCRFNAPTVNLYFENLHEYVKYVKYLKEYSSLPLQEFHDHDFPYPVGTLESPEHGIVHIYFMHYHSFDEARRKWEERTKRIVWKHYYMLLQLSYADAKLIEEMAELPCPKIIITYTKIFSKISNVIQKHKIPCYILKDLEHGRQGEALGYSGWFGRRYIDAFDVVGFLNAAKNR